MNIRVLDKNGGAQGDVLIMPIAELPEGLVEQPRGAEIVAAHSETGHHHVVVGDWLRWFTDPKDPLVAYLLLDDGHTADVEHRRDFDTHETQRLDGGVSKVWKFSRQQEMSPEGWRTVAD